MSWWDAVARCETWYFVQLSSSSSYVIQANWVNVIDSTGVIACRTFPFTPNRSNPLTWAWWTDKCQYITSGFSSSLVPICQHTWQHESTPTFEPMQMMRGSAVMRLAETKVWVWLSMSRSKLQIYNYRKTSHIRPYPRFFSIGQYETSAAFKVVNQDIKWKMRLSTSIINLGLHVCCS